MWCVRELDDKYIERMEDVLRLYAKPYDPAQPVICFDEKSVQLLADVYPTELSQPGKIARRDSEYRRCGTANIFCAIEPKLGQQFLKVTKRRTALDFAEALSDLAALYPTAKTIHLVLDNLNVHCFKSLLTRFGKAKAQRLWKRFALHYTPKHASWLNQAEIQISCFSRAVLRRSRIANISQLKRVTRAYRKRVNRKPTPFSWRFSVRDAQSKFRYHSHPIR